MFPLGRIRPLYSAGPIWDVLIIHPSQELTGRSEQFSSGHLTQHRQRCFPSGAEYKFCSSALLVILMLIWRLNTVGCRFGEGRVKCVVQYVPAGSQCGLCWNIWVGGVLTDPFVGFFIWQQHYAKTTEGISMKFGPGSRTKQRDSGADSGTFYMFSCQYSCSGSDVLPFCCKLRHKLDFFCNERNIIKAYTNMVSMSGCHTVCYGSIRVNKMFFFPVKYNSVEIVH